MKSYLRNFLKVIFLFLFVFITGFGLQAKDSFVSLEKNTKPKVNYAYALKNLLAEEEVLVEEATKVENWMLDIHVESDNSEIPLENWMKDEDFWKVKNSFSNTEEPVEEPIEIESWMTNFNV